jgi:hypothetical protein
MTGCNPINWEDVACELDNAPNIFLRKASRIWRGKLSRNREQQHSGLSKKAPNDAQLQARWKTAYESATDELLYCGEFIDKGEHIRLLQTVKVVNRTPKQIHIVAAYTLYRCMMRNSSQADLWSSRSDGGLFGHFYADWKPVTRYRLLRVSRDKIFNSDVLDTANTSNTQQDETTYAMVWKRFCSLCLFVNRDEYARWHLTRYEGTVERLNNSRGWTRNINYSSTLDLYAVLEISKRSSQKEINAAYKRMAMRHHPDRGGSADKFHKVKFAYDALCKNRCK